MKEVEKKALCNLYVAYFTLTEEIENLIKYSNEIETDNNYLEISYKTGIIINKFLSVNTILFNTFTRDLYTLYGEKQFIDTFETDIFAFVLYLRNLIVHEGFYKIKVNPTVRIEISKDSEKYQIFKINLTTKDIIEFLNSEIQRKPLKNTLILKAKNYIEKYIHDADITEVLIEYYDKIIELYKIFEKNLGVKIAYLK